MATQYTQWRFPRSRFFDGQIELRINRNNRNYSVTASETITLDSRYAIPYPESLKYSISDAEGYAVADSITFNINDSYQYSGEVNGSPVSENLVADRTSLFNLIFDSDSVQYTAFLTFIHRDGTEEVVMIGDIDPLTISRDHGTGVIFQPQTAQEYIIGQVTQFEVQSAVLVLNSYTVQDLVDSYSVGDMLFSDAAFYAGISVRYLGTWGLSTRNAAVRAGGLNYGFFGYTGQFESIATGTWPAGNTSAVTVISVLKHIADICGFSFEDNSAASEQDFIPGLDYWVMPYEGDPSAEYSYEKVTDPYLFALCYHYAFGVSPYDGADFEFPSSFKRTETLGQVVRAIANQFGCSVYTDIDQSAKKIRLRLIDRRESRGTYPSSFILAGESKEEQREIYKTHVVVKNRADEDSCIVTPRGYVEDDPIEVQVPFRARKFGFTSNAGWADEHLLPNPGESPGKLGYSEQVKYSLRTFQPKDGDKQTNPDGWVPGAHLFVQYDAGTPAPGTNKFYPTAWSIPPDVSSWSGMVAVSACSPKGVRDGAANDAELSKHWNTLLGPGQLVAQELLNNRTVISRRYVGIKDDSDSVLGVRPGIVDSWWYRGQIRTFRAIEVEKQFVEGVTTIKWIEIPTDYADLNYFPYRFESGGDSTSGSSGGSGGTTSGSNSGTVTFNLPTTSNGALLVDAASTTNVILTGSVTTVDGVSLSDDDVVLVAGNTDATENGPYIVKSTGWLRVSNDPDDWRSIYVRGGTINGGNWALTTTGTIVVDTTALEFKPVAFADGITNFGAQFDGKRSLTETRLDYSGSNAYVEIANDAGDSVPLVQLDGTNNAGQAVLKMLGSGAGTVMEITGGSSDDFIGMLVSVLNTGSGSVPVQIVNRNQNSALLITGIGTTRTPALIRVSCDSGNALNITTTGSGTNTKLKTTASSGTVLDVETDNTGNGNYTASFSTNGINYAVRAYSNGTGPTVYVECDPSGGTSQAMRVVQKGTGNILELYDNATEVLAVADGGQTTAQHIHLASRISLNATSVTSTTTLADDDGPMIEVDTSASGGNITVTLPSAANKPNELLYLIDIGANCGTNTCTISRAGSETINGGTTTGLFTNYARKILYSDGANWFIMGV